MLDWLPRQTCSPIVTPSGPAGALARVRAQERAVAGVVELHVADALTDQRLDLGAGDRGHLPGEFLARGVELAGLAVLPEPVHQESRRDQRHLDRCGRQAPQVGRFALGQPPALREPAGDHELLAGQLGDPAARMPRHVEGAHRDSVERGDEAGAEVATAELAVGDDGDAGLLLPGHRDGDRLVLDRAQVAGSDRAGVAALPRLEQGLRAEQAADVVGAERG
jgi:hypothetical protein